MKIFAFSKLRVHCLDVLAIQNRPLRKVSPRVYARRRCIRICHQSYSISQVSAAGTIRSRLCSFIFLTYIYTPHSSRGITSPYIYTSQLIKFAPKMPFILRSRGGMGVYLKARGRRFFSIIIKLGSNNDKTFTSDTRPRLRDATTFCPQLWRRLGD